LSESERSDADTAGSAGPVVRAPASSANLGAGFDVFGLALDLYAEAGVGPAPDGAVAIDDNHPGRIAFDMFGGSGPMWLRSSIPMARGMGFSGAVRVAAAALGVVAGRAHDIGDSREEILYVTAELEGHGDNVAASLYGGVVAYVEGRLVPFVVGPTLGAARFVAWVPDVTTSTDTSRKSLSDSISRSAAVHNIGRAVQFALAFAHDDPQLLHRATDDRIHQAERLPAVPGAADAIEAGEGAGAWCGWLSGSGPTVGFLADAAVADSVAAALPEGGHTKILSIDRLGAHVVSPR